MSDEPFHTPNRKSAPTPAMDSIVARRISGSHSTRFEDQYLCPKCGQSGAIGIHALKAGGTATCPECGAAMNKTR
jgi:predicted RNA-binding Zn-ribbon protein involved in translation (DUF1610 family)